MRGKAYLSYEGAFVVVSHDERFLLGGYGRLQEEFTRRGGWEIDACVDTVLEVFGLGGLTLSPAGRGT